MHVDRDLLGQVAAGDRRGHLGDVAHLAGQVAGHHVDVVGKVLPDAADALHLRLAAELSFRAHLAGDARHLAGERVELVHHGVDGGLELEHLALHVDRDLLRQIAHGDRRRHLGDVAHLAGQVGGHEVDVVGEVLPGAGDALDLGLAAELALRAHLARDARHLAGEGAELAHHGVHDLADAQELAPQGAALDLELHGLAEVALGDGADDARDLDGRLHEVADQGVHRIDAFAPAAARRRQVAAFADLALFADHLGEPVEFSGQALIEVGDVIERFGDFAVEAGQVEGETDGKIAFPERPQCLEKQLGIERRCDGGGLWHLIPFGNTRGALGCAGPLGPGANQPARPKP